MLHDSGKAFVRAAPGKQTYPWQAPNVSKHHEKDFHHKIIEELKVKIDWLAGKKDTPIKECLAEALERYFADECRLMGYYDV